MHVTSWLNHLSQKEDPEVQTQTAYCKCDKLGQGHVTPFCFQFAVSLEKPILLQVSIDGV